MTLLRALPAAMVDARAMLAKNALESPAELVSRC